VAPHLGFAALKHLPHSQFNERLREQGIIDNALVSLGRSLQEADDANRRMERLSDAMYGSLLVGKAMPTEIVGSPEDALSRLFKALVARPTSRRPGRSKADVLDRTVAALRHVGAPVRVGQYEGDFLFDAVVDSDRGGSVAVHTQSFHVTRRHWSSIEHEAAHFLYAIGRLSQAAVSVIEPPARDADAAATGSYERVGRWFADAGVEVTSLSTLPGLVARFETPHQLSLIAAI
jgi:hypothetical protein